MFALISAMPAAVVSLTVGLLLVLVSRKWRKLLGGIVGVAFPVALISVAVVGSALAPPELTVGESAVRTTRELLGSVNKARNDTPSYLWVDLNCWLFLRETVAENLGQYTVTLVSEYDSANDPRAVHDSTEATVLVDFPDRRQTKIWFFNGGAATCTYTKP
jgi:hypothetical protein